MILFCTFKNILITLNKTADFATFLKGSSSKEMWSLKNTYVGLNVLLLCQAVCYSFQDHNVTLTLERDVIW
ncbi:Threonine Synthase-Like 2 [Manis pentadactyla]|nr:Threonine Synthase-Like 2 [Manis pentadactyla]